MLETAAMGTGSRIRALWGRANSGASVREALLTQGGLRMFAALGLLAALAPLTACKGFFVPPTSTGTSGTGTGFSGSTTTDYAYVANSSAGTTSLAAYNVGSGALTSVGTVSLGFIPVALAVAPSDSFLYVASTPGYTSPGIYLYTIGSTGALTAANSGKALATDAVAAMAISPDGNWLYTVNIDGLTMAEYAVDTTTGLLTLQGEITLPGSTCNLTTATPVSQSCSVAVAPSGDYVVASLNVSGDAVFSYSSSGGVTGSSYRTIGSGYSTANPTGDFSVALDANNYAYIAQTNSVSVYGIGSTTIDTEGTTDYGTGLTPRGVALSQSGGYVYTANEAAGTISGFGIGGSGALTAVSGSPFAGPANVSALGFDKSGGYAVAVGYDASAGVRLYSVSSAGVLTQVAATGSGTSEAYPALVAMTH